VYRLAVSLCIVLASAATLLSQRSRTVFRANVNSVVVTFTVSDGRGRYVKDLRQKDLQVFEDGVEQKVLSFEGQDVSAPTDSASQANRVWILFDTSNVMYGGFPQAEDCIAAFTRSLAPGTAVAVYSFTRNVTRLAEPTLDHEAAVGRMRQATVGDDTALFDSILVTLRDAARLPGRNTLVVFSNGPDDSSMLTPDDVAQVANDAGIPIYVVSTHMTDDSAQPLLSRITAVTGGRAYDAPTLVKQQAAYRSIREDLRNSYMVAYAPPPHSGFGFHKIEVRIPSAPGSEVRARSGYTTPPDSD